MKLLATCRDVGDIAVVDFSGQITLGEGSAALRKMTKDLLASGKLKVLIDKTFPLSDAAGAHAYIESRKAVGRVLLIP